jgi:AcrR family transcriptional regulator
MSRQEVVETQRERDKGTPERTVETQARSRREVVEAHLLDIAAQQFASGGYRQTTIEEIAQQAGLSKASMYHYFENKQELLCKIFLKVGATFTRVLEPILAAPLPPEEKLRRAVRYMVQIMGENVALFSVFYREEGDLPPALRQQLVEVRQRHAAGLENILREGMEQGVFRKTDERLLVQAIMGMCAWLHRWYHPEEDQLEDIVAVFLGLIEHGCLATRGGEAQSSLADRLQNMQDTLGSLIEQAKRLEKSSAPTRR